MCFIVFWVLYMIETLSLSFALFGLWVLLFSEFYNCVSREIFFLNNINKAIYHGLFSKYEKWSGSIIKKAAFIKAGLLLSYRF